MSLFLDIFVKVFFILSPFFSVSMFLLLSGNMDRRTSRRCALRTSTAIAAQIIFNGISGFLNAARP